MVDKHVKPWSFVCSVLACGHENCDLLAMPWQQAAGKAKSALNWGESTVPELIPFRASATDCEGTGTDVM